MLSRQLAVQDTYIEEDKELVQSYFELGEDEKTRRMSPWLLRIELNRYASIRVAQRQPLLLG